MNITVIIVELLVMFLAFGFIVIGLLMISPLTFISDCPPEIQETYYRTRKKEAAKEKLNAIMLVKKSVAIVAFMFVIAWMLHVAGTENMDKEYHQKWFHVKVCLPMIPVFVVVGALSSLIMIWIW